MRLRNRPSLQALCHRTPNVARRLRVFRNAANFTQDALARRAGLAAKYISEIENGHANPSIAVLARLVEQGLDMPIAKFFDEPEELRADLMQIESIFAAMPAATRRIALRVMRALADV